MESFISGCLTVLVEFAFRGAAWQATHRVCVSGYAPTEANFVNTRKKGTSQRNLLSKEGVGQILKSTYVGGRTEYTIRQVMSCQSRAPQSGVWRRFAIDFF